MTPIQTVEEVLLELQEGDPEHAGLIVALEQIPLIREQTKCWVCDEREQYLAGIRKELIDRQKEECLKALEDVYQRGLMNDKQYNDMKEGIINAT